MIGLKAFGVIVWLTAYLSIAFSHREHKVHNIVLYPDKHSWCKTLPIKQVISYPGCKSEEIDNNVCVGACFSYSIPHTEPSDPSEVIVPYCDSCQPSETTWQHVTLGCSKGTTDALVKRVEIIVNCSCSSCDQMNGHRDMTDDDELLLHYNDVPDLLNTLNIRNESNTVIPSEHTENVKNMMNNKIVALLQSIQEKNNQNDKAQLIELLQLVQSPEQKLSEKSLSNFVDSLSSEHIELDVPKLKEVLAKLEENSKLYEKHRKYGLGNDIQGSTLSLAAGNDEINANEKLNGDGHGKDGSIIKDIVSDSGEQHSDAKEHHHSHHQQHHAVGETFGHGHLVKGPRGALIIEPVHNIHEKLEVNPHELKLNHAGAMLTYGSHLSEKNSKTVDG